MSIGEKIRYGQNLFDCVFMSLDKEFKQLVILNWKKLYFDKYFKTSEPQKIIKNANPFTLTMCLEMAEREEWYEVFFTGFSRV